MLNLHAPTFNRQPMTRQLPPTVGTWPLLGAAPNLARQQLQFLFDARERHGDIYTLRVGLLNIVTLNHPDHAQHILRGRVENYRKGGITWDRVRMVLGNGILVSEGAFWLRQRRMLQPQFHRQRLAELTDTMVAAIDEVMNRWDQHGDQSVELTEHFLQITSNVILKTMFGSLVSPEQMQTLLKVINAGARYVGVNLSKAFLPGWLQWTSDHRAMQLRQTVDEILYAMIAQCRAAEQAGQSDGHLISMLLNVVDDETGEPMTDEEMRDEIASMLFAGMETTAVTLAWAQYFIMQHPAVLERMRHEVATALGGRRPTFEDLAALSYTKQVVQETLRLRPSGSMLARTAVADDVIDGYHIPANSLVVLPLQVIHRHPDFGEQPDVFDPERFAAGAPPRHSCAWIPFGSGQRMCIGREFAMMEMQLVLAMFLQRFAVTPKSGVATDPAAVLILRPRGAIEAYVTRREAEQPAEQGCDNAFAVYNGNRLVPAEPHPQRTTSEVQRGRGCPFHWR